MITTVAELIAQAESSNNQYAIRYEPTHKPAAQFVSLMMVAAKCSEATAVILCSCSWGLYQIMGDELMAKGLKFSPLNWIQSLQLQELYFDRVLDEKGIDTISLEEIINDETLRLEFATKYNGPGQPDVYAQYLIDTYNKVNN